MSNEFNNGDMPASPTIGTMNRVTNKFDETQVSNNDFMLFGLTKRERFAMAAMTGLCNAHAPDGTWAHDAKDVAVTAVQYADALLAELAKDHQ